MRRAHSRLRIGTCEGCGARIMQPRHIRTGKIAPIEVQPSDDGNVLVTGDTYEIVPADEREMVKRRGFVLRKNHFASCDYARSFANPPERKTPQRKQHAVAVNNVIRGPWEKFSN